MIRAKRNSADHVRRALALLDAAADGAGDEDVTPAEIAGEVDAALTSGPDPLSDEARRLLLDGADAISDGLPADHVVTILNRALARLTLGPSA